jgi:hypothetical protein
MHPASTGIGAKEIRPVYAAPTEAAAKERFVEFTATCGQQYPAIIRSWLNAWSEFVPFLDCNGFTRLSPMVSCARPIAAPAQPFAIPFCVTVGHVGSAVSSPDVLLQVSWHPSRATVLTSDRTSMVELATVLA